MGSLRFSVLSRYVCLFPLVAALMSPLHGQAAPLRPRHDLAAALLRLDTVLENLRQLEEASREVAQLAQEAHQHGKEAEIETVVRLGAELSAKVNALAELAQRRRQELQEVRERAAIEAPSRLLEDSESLQAKVQVAMNAPDLGQALVALQRLETELTAADPKVESRRDAALGFLRYAIADVHRRTGEMQIKQRVDNKLAEKSFEKATVKYREVLNCEDTDSSGFGTSLHADALRRVVLIEASLYEGYHALAAKQPSVRSHAEAARKHRTAAEQAFERLQRAYGEARLPDGQLMVDAARQAVSRLRQR